MSIEMNIITFKNMRRNRHNREAIYSTSQYWDTKAVQHEGDAVSMWPNNSLNIFYHHEVISVFKALFGDFRGLKILDLGCGTGWNSRYLAEQGALVVGIDFSAESVEIARRSSFNDNPIYKIQSLFQLEEYAVYDAAISWGTLTFACRNRAEVLDVLTRIARSLKPGGRLLLCEPIHKGFLHRVLNMNIRELSAILLEAGFDIERIRHLHFWPMRLALAYISWPRFITAAGYRTGQAIMALFGKRCFGDYKVIYATVKAKG
jgi:2-polyprenyl-3-methyl-5-hydroxy-6-metoxy-1,4-benzoquinol methylase